MRPVDENHDARPVRHGRSDTRRDQGWHLSTWLDAAVCSERPLHHQFCGNPFRLACPCCSGGRLIDFLDSRVRCRNCSSGETRKSGTRSNGAGKERPGAPEADKGPSPISTFRPSRTGGGAASLVTTALAARRRSARASSPPARSSEGTDQEQWNRQPLVGTDCRNSSMRTRCVCGPTSPVGCRTPAGARSLSYRASFFNS